MYSSIAASLPNLGSDCCFENDERTIIITIIAHIRRSAYSSNNNSNNRGGDGVVERTKGSDAGSIPATGGIFL